MQELVVISGKGGTGKTSLTAAFAALAHNCVLCDADVDASDLHLLLNPRVRRLTDFSGGGEAVIDQETCTRCGTCFELCRFEAVEYIGEAMVQSGKGMPGAHYQIDAIACEGCGVCVDLCPAGAIDFPEKICGKWFISDTRFGPMVHARLGIAEENSGKLVTLVRKVAGQLAEEQQADLIITDGPPGIGCPVIASIGGATALLIVSEPTVSGLHDMQRVADLARHFKVPCMLCVNKSDLNPGQTAAIEVHAAEQEIVCVGRIPFDPVFVRAMIQGQTIAEYEPGGKIELAIRQIWRNVAQRLAGAAGGKGVPERVHQNALTGGNVR